MERAYHVPFNTELTGLQSTRESNCVGMSFKVSVLVDCWESGCVLSTLVFLLGDGEGGEMGIRCACFVAMN